MPQLRAVLFDLGGTLYDYRTLAVAEAETLFELTQWVGITATSDAIRQAYQDSIRRVFHSYLSRPFYLHRDLFRDAMAGMLEPFGVQATDELWERHRTRQWERFARDFMLRDGVVDTLRALRDRGLHLGIVSNIDEDQLAHIMGLARIDQYFDSQLSSEAAASCKPDRAIFAEALRRAGCGADEALFVGDTLAQDIAGANRVGLWSVLLWHRADRDPPKSQTQPDYVIRRIPELLEVVAECTGQ